MDRAISYEYMTIDQLERLYTKNIISVCDGDIKYIKFDMEEK